MKILLTRIWKKLSQHIESENYKSALEHHDGHSSIGAYSILCRLEQRSDR
jgi:hypothetical protein